MANKERKPKPAVCVCGVCNKKIAFGAREKARYVINDHFQAEHSKPYVANAY